MAFVPFPNGARACVGMAIGQVDVSVCLHFQGAPGATPADYQLLADTLYDAWVTHMLPEQVNVVELTDVTVYDLNSDSAPIYIKTDTPNPIGTLPGLSVPLNVAMVLSHSTGNRGRSFRGRTYLPGLSEADLGTRDWVASAIADTETAFINMIIEVEQLTTWVFSIASRVTGGIERTTGVMTDVILTKAKSEAGTRRKRLPGDF